MPTPSQSRRCSTTECVSKAKAVSPNPLYRFLYKTPAKVLVPRHRTLVTVQENNSIFDALSILHSNKILAAPVLSSDGTCVGSIDVLSILAYQGPGTSQWESPEELWADIKDLTVKVVAENTIERKKLIPFFSENPVSMLVDLFGTGIHRVALFHRNKELISTLSQSDVVRYIAMILKHAQSQCCEEGVVSPLPSSPGNGNVTHSSDSHTSTLPLPTPTEVNFQALVDVGKLKARDLNLFQVVKTISSQTSMIHAMKELAACLRQGLAIVDASGVLVGDISVSDLHDLPEANLSSLNMTVVHWLQAFSTASLNPPTTTIDATLGELIIRFTKEKVHRLWVIDGEGLPTHVVSLTDILAALSSGDTVDDRKASGDTHISLLWRITSPPFSPAY